MRRAMPPRSRSRSLAALLAGCARLHALRRGSRTQRWPRADGARASTRCRPGTRAATPTGPEEVARRAPRRSGAGAAGGRAGELSAAVLRQERCASPRAARCSARAGGRVEILWPDGQLDRALRRRRRRRRLARAAASRASTFATVERARSMLDARATQIELARRRAPARATPAAVPCSTRVRDDILRVTNQSQAARRGRLPRASASTLDPGQAVDLPMLSTGGGDPSRATAACSASARRRFASTCRRLRSTTHERSRGAARERRRASSAARRARAPRAGRRGAFAGSSGAAGAARRRPSRSRPASRAVRAAPPNRARRRTTSRRRPTPPHEP